MAKAKTVDTNQITALVRSHTGKGASRRARQEGKIPAVLYGHGSDPQHLELPAREFAAVLRYAGTNAVLTLNIDGTEQYALTKALDIHPIRRNIQHADLLVVRRGEKVTVDVSVVVEGDAAPGTLVNQETNTIEIEASELAGRLFQHELDHLNGVLMFDRMEADQRKAALAEYRRILETPAEPAPKRRLRLK